VKLLSREEPSAVLISSEVRRKTDLMAGVLDAIGIASTCIFNR
jgi:hypothetical protein